MEAEILEAQAETERRNRAKKALKSAPRPSAVPSLAHTTTTPAKSNGTAANGQQHDATTHLWFMFTMYSSTVIVYKEIYFTLIPVYNIWFNVDNCIPIRI